MSEGVKSECRGNGLYAATFSAMASPCEVLLETDDPELAAQLGNLAAAETWRIEAKFSRYLPDSVVALLNASEGRPVKVDPETASMLDFASHCHRLSDGAFDITSGILRKAWRFDASASLPTRAQVDALLSHVGFGKLSWTSPYCTVPKGMELDFGGIGKEYAVDRVLQAVTQRFNGAALVNFGGDLAANRAPAQGPWIVGIERPGTDRQARMILDFSSGGLATSGDTHRFIERAGQRYGHILDVRTGWPVRDAPRSVTVAAGTCVQAGLLSTLAMLQGAGAEEFLKTMYVPHWCLR